MVLAADFLQKPEIYPSVSGAFPRKIPSSTKYIIPYKNRNVNCNFVFFPKTNDFQRWKRKNAAIAHFFIDFFIGIVYDTVAKYGMPLG